MILAHRSARLSTSLTLRVPGKKGDSVVVNVLVEPGRKCRVVLQASIPYGATSSGVSPGAVVPTKDALLAQVVGEVELAPRLASSLIVMEVGVLPVSVLLMRFATAPRWTVWSGVMRQEQQDTNSSFGSIA